MSFVALDSPTEMCVADKMFYGKLNPALNQWSRGTHTLSWVTSMLKLPLKELAMSYVLVPMTLISRTPTALLNFAKARRLRIAGS